MAFAAKNGLDCHVLLRADGGDPIICAGFPVVGSSIGILVDFADPGDDRRKLERRINSYRRRGWILEHVSPKRNKNSRTILDAIAGKYDLELIAGNAVHNNAGSDCGQDPIRVAKPRRRIDSVSAGNARPIQ